MIQHDLRLVLGGSRPKKLRTDASLLVIRLPCPDFANTLIVILSLGKDRTVPAREDLLSRERMNLDERGLV